MRWFNFDTDNSDDTITFRCFVLLLFVNKNVKFAPPCFFFWSRARLGLCDSNKDKFFWRLVAHYAGLDDLYLDAFTPDFCPKIFDQSHSMSNIEFWLAESHGRISIKVFAGRDYKTLDVLPGGRAIGLLEKSQAGGRVDIH